MTNQAIDNPSPRPPGRPCSLTPAVQDIIYQAVREGMYFKRACELADIDESTFQRWRKEAEQGDDRYKQLFILIKKAEAEHQQARLAEIREAGKKPHNWQASAWQLERRYKDEYSQQKDAPQVQQQTNTTQIIIAGNSASLAEVLRAARQLQEQQTKVLPPPDPESGLKEDKGT